MIILSSGGKRRYIHIGRKAPKGYRELPGAMHLGGGKWMIPVEPEGCVGSADMMRDESWPEEHFRPANRFPDLEEQAPVAKPDKAPGYEPGE